MAFYRTHILPRIVDKALGTKEATEARRSLCGGVHGDVVEIGFGSGRNLEHYPTAVTGVWAVEPSTTARRIAQARVSEARMPVTWAGLDGERLDLPDGRFDSAVSTWTLCTIPDVAAALAEIRRVLKPGGVLHFVEHGRSPDAGVRRWQQRLEPINKRIAGGCHLQRPIADLITDAGFGIDALETYYAKGDPKPFGYRYAGQARSGVMS